MKIRRPLALVLGSLYAVCLPGGCNAYAEDRLQPHAPRRLRGSIPADDTARRRLEEADAEDEGEEPPPEPMDDDWSKNTFALPQWFSGEYSLGRANGGRSTVWCWDAHKKIPHLLLHFCFDRYPSNRPSRLQRYGAGRHGHCHGTSGVNQVKDCAAARQGEVCAGRGGCMGGCARGWSGRVGGMCAAACACVCVCVRVCWGGVTRPGGSHNRNQCPSPNTTMMQVESALMETKRNIVESSPLTEGWYSASRGPYKVFCITLTSCHQITNKDLYPTLCFHAPPDRHAGGVCGARVRGSQGRSEGDHGRT